MVCQCMEVITPASEIRLNFLTRNVPLLDDFNRVLLKLDEESSQDSEHDDNDDEDDSSEEEEEESTKYINASHVNVRFPIHTVGLCRAVSVCCRVS